MKTKYKSLTLMELMVSLVLFTIVVMALSVFDIFGHFHSITSDRRAAVQNELSLVLEHITKTVTGSALRGGAIGDVNNPPFILDSDQTGFSIRIDSPINLSLPSGINYGNDVWVGYHQEGNAMCCYPNDSQPELPQRTSVHTGNKESIAMHLLPTTSSIAIGSRGFELTTPVLLTVPTSVTAYNACAIVLRSRWIPANAIAIDNPQAQMQETIVAPATSIH